MADVIDLPPAPDDAGERGALTVRDRVYERIADRAMTDTSGVSTAPTGLTRRSASRVHISNRNGRVEARADIATVWPRPAGTIAAAAQANIGKTLSDAATPADSVVVYVTSVQPPTAAVSSAGDRAAVDPAAADALTVAARPRERPAAAATAVVCAFVMLAAAVVAVRDALVYGGAVSGTPWIGWVLERLDGRGPESAMVPLGIGVGVVGLIVVLLALKPRARLYRPTRFDDVWVSKVGIERSVQSTAAATIESTAPVTGAAGQAAPAPRVRTKVRAKSATVTVHAPSSADGDRIDSSVRQAVSRQLAVLDPPLAPNVSVKLTGGKQ